MAAFRVVLGTAPTILSTSTPFLNIFKLGIEVIPKRAAKPSFSSTSTLAIIALDS